MYLEQQTLSHLQATKSYYTPREASEVIKLSPQAITRRLRLGKMKGYRSGKAALGRWRIYPNEIENYRQLYQDHRSMLIDESMRYWGNILKRKGLLS